MCRKIFLYLFIALGLSVSQPCLAQQKEASIRIVQEEGVFLSDFQSVIQLKKKAFKFQVILKNCDGVYVFASINDSVYRFTENSPIQDFSYLKLLQLRDEDIFNSNRELNISETGWSYWFYSSTADWHPFNRKVMWLDTDRVACTKVIKQLFDVNTNKTIKLRDLSRPLYILFIAVAEYDANGKPIRELMRRKLKIEWVEED